MCFRPDVTVVRSLANISVFFIAKVTRTSKTLLKGQRKRKMQNQSIFVLIQCVYIEKSGTRKNKYNKQLS